MVIEELASRRKLKDKNAETARNKETLKSGGTTKPKKKKKQSQKKELELTVEADADLDHLESCEMIKHKSDKRGEVRVLVKWDDSGKSDWQYLYDMWADYPSEVTRYKKNNKTSCKGNLWKLPNIDNVEYFVRILGMLGEADEVTEAVFIVLANNGYKFDGEDCVKYDELLNDDPELLEAFLESLEDSPDTEDASIA
jgi:hypothetical protein